MKNTRGQILLEYVVMLGFLVMALYYMSPAIKRGYQSAIKITADQIGNQEESDQTVNRRLDSNGRIILSEEDENDSFLAESKSSSKVSGSRRMTDRIYVTNMDINEKTESFSNSVTEMGFTQQ